MHIKPLRTLPPTTPPLIASLAGQPVMVRQYQTLPSGGVLVQLAATIPATGRLLHFWVPAQHCVLYVELWRAAA